MGGLREGRQVTLHIVADGLEIPARVLRVDADVVELDPPALIGGRHRVEPGTAVEILWRDRRREGSVRALVERSAATISLRLFSERRHAQRRAYIRTRTLLGLEIATQAGARVRGVGTEVSAVGLQARIAAPFAVGDHMLVAIRLPDGDPVELVARVARRHPNGAAGLAFVEPSKDVSERLIRFVLASQQRAIARSSAPSVPAGPASLRRIEGGRATRP